jgi:hypothetical protein
MLREFHATLNVHGGLAPQAPAAGIPDWVRDLRLKLLDEEVAELREAMQAGDLVKIADGLADIVYVTVGTAVPYGIPFDAVLAEVHRSNMTKANDPGLGKLVKGPGYEAPRITEILEQFAAAAVARDTLPAVRTVAVHVLLCPDCAGYAPITGEDYRGFLSGECQGCGATSRELHRFPALAHSAGGCRCRSRHARVAGDAAVPGRLPGSPA